MYMCAAVHDVAALQDIEGANVYIFIAYLCVRRLRVLKEARPSILSFQASYVQLPSVRQQQLSDAREQYRTGLR